jgi:hypothetical protein
MATKEELQKQIEAAEAKGAEGHKLIEQGRQMQHDAVAEANGYREQLRQLDIEAQKPAEGNQPQAHTL